MTNNDESIIRFPPVVGLPPINRPDYSLRAISYILDFRVEILTSIHPYGLNDKDLTDDEIAKRQQYVNNILSWLNGCTKDVTGWRLTLQLISPVGSSAMSQLRQLLKGAYDRKAGALEKAKEEEEKRAARAEAERRAKNALAIIAPPEEEARRLFSKPVYELFIKSIDGAVDAVIEAQDRGDNRPEAWMEDSRALEYMGWVSEIRKIKNERLRQQEDTRQAELATNLAISLRTASVHKFRDELSKNIKPILPYQSVLHGYHPGKWCELNLPTDEQIREWAKEEIRKRLPIVLTSLVRWSLNWEMKLLPNASYEVKNGIPCIRWEFTALILLTANLKLGNCQLFEQYPGYSKLVQGEGQKLGTIYLRVNWGCGGSFSTSVILLRTLAEGKMEAPGVTVVARSGLITTFLISGVEVAVHDNFREFIVNLAKKKIPLWQSLLKTGLIDTQLAELLEQKWSQQLPQASSGSLHGEVNKGDVVDKLTKMGLAETDAVNIVQTLVIPPNATADDVVKLAVEKYEAGI